MFLFMIIMPESSPSQDTMIKCSYEWKQSQPQLNHSSLFSIIYLYFRWGFFPLLLPKTNCLTTFRIDSEMESLEQVFTNGSEVKKKKKGGWFVSFCPKHCSGICKKQKAEELVVKKLLFKMPEKQSSPL